MNKRFFISVTASAALALAMAGTAMAGSGFAYQDRDHKGTEQKLIIEPGSDPSSIQLHFAGADRVRLSFAGTLDIINGDGHVWHYHPQVYQMVNGKQKMVPVTFGIMGKDRVTLHVSKFDTSEPLVVSPVKGPAATM